MTKFFPLTGFTTGFADKVPLGRLAYFTRHNLWMLGAEIQGSAKLICLNGARGMTIYSTSSYGGDAILIAPEWRIEAGAPPYVNGMYDARIGHAYRSSEGVGLYAAWAGDEGLRHALAFNIEGRNVEFKQAEAVIAFPNWRIVVGPTDTPFVIAEFGAASNLAAGG